MKFLLGTWFSISVLIVLILFIPYEVSFLTFKPFDFWLFTVLIYNAKKIILPKGILINILFAISFLSVLSTFLQALKDSLTFDLVFFSNFYRYFRLIIIMTVVKSLVKDANTTKKIINSYFVIGLITILISIIQIFDIAPLAILFNYLYDDKETFSSFKEYGKLDRFGGIMGNANSMGIVLSSFGAAAITKFTYLKSSFANRVLFILYFISIFIIVVFFTSSRTSVLVLLIILLIWLLTARFRNSLITLIILLIPLIFLVSNIDFYDYQNLNRVLYLFETKTAQGNEGNIAEIFGRDQLWKGRLDVFFNKGHNLSLFFGMGYTGLYYDYADNGLLTYFINLGIIGLILKIFILLFLAKVLYGALFECNDYWRKSVAIITVSLILFEASAEAMDHIKIGPLLFIFIQIITSRYNKIFINRNNS